MQLRRARILLVLELTGRYGFHFASAAFCRIHAEEFVQRWLLLLLISSLVASKAMAAQVYRFHIIAVQLRPKAKRLILYWSPTQREMVAGLEFMMARCLGVAF